MAIPLLASSLIEGIYAFDVVSWGFHSLHLQTATCPSLMDLGVMKMTLAQGHSAVPALSSPWDASASWMVVAQYFETDVFADARAWWSDFVSSGKIWTLIFGIVLGYILRALTSYG